MLVQTLLQEPASAVQARHDRADRATHDVGDLAVRELFDVGEHDRQAELFGELVERRDDFLFEDRPERARLRIAHRLHGRRADPAVGQRIGVGSVEHAALEPAAPVAVDERVRQNAEQPGAHVAARHEVLTRAERLQQRVLNEVLGFDRASRQPRAHRHERREVRRGPHARSQSVGLVWVARVRIRVTRVLTANEGSQAIIPKERAAPVTRGRPFR